MNSSTKPAVNRAAAALNALLSQVSAITVKEIGLESPGAGSDLPNREIDLLAHVEVFGRAHTLACEITSGIRLDNICAALEELRSRIAHLPGEVTPVLIVPVLSAEVQKLCSQSQAGCVDLRGNGRLSIGEVFVSMRSLPSRPYHRPATAMRTASASAEEGRTSQPAYRGFPPVSIGIPQSSTRAVSHAGQPYS